MTAIKPLVGVSACRIEVNGLSMQRCSEKYLMAAAGEVAATPMIIPSLPTPLDVASMIARLDGLLLTGSPSNVEPGHYDGP
ncbi:MAG: gamma-glutamyl-gamma-aminobutyrate hydrolase family protein, partial [Pseudomonadota bacterium]|nr:gamma-glutamyl-gamma-aminobutyrate hydrolase family protein [Pseudomonadota bacterium]